MDDRTKTVQVTRTKGRFTGAVVGGLIAGPLGAVIGGGLGTRTETTTEAYKPPKYSQEWAESEEGKAVLAQGAAQWRFIGWVFAVICLLALFGAFVRS